MTIASQHAVSFAQSCCDRIRQLNGIVPWSVDEILFQRALENGWEMGGQISANQRCQLLSCRDGWVAVNLPRVSDWEDVPAWLGEDIAVNDWDAIAKAVATRNAHEVTHFGQELGLAVSAVRQSEQHDEQQLFRMSAGEQMFSFLQGTPRNRNISELKVADLSSLWAGPLCGSLLAAAGAQVTKYETLDRPDGSRRGNKAFFDRIHARHQFATIEFTAEVVRSLFDQADVVITSSRPRALAALGITPADFCESTTCWIAITGYGSFGPWQNRVGFGDDLAAAGGLVDEGPSFVGDAIADPLTGLVAAAAALNVAKMSGGFLDISMRDIAYWAAQQREPQW